MLLYLTPYEIKGFERIAEVSDPFCEGKGIRMNKSSRRKLKGRP